MTNEERDQWLASLKPGDEVVVSGHFRHNLEKVADATAHFFLVGRTRFSRKTGYATGHSGSYLRPRVDPPTDELRAEIELRQLAVKLGNTHWGKLSLAKLREVSSIVEEKA